jgi:hypothetical protein
MIKKLSVPDPYPITIAGMLAALGPMTLSFGISVGGGEAQLLPYMSAAGMQSLFWLMWFGGIFEAFLVIEVIKNTALTGRSFFAMTRDIPPIGWWPWIWILLAALGSWWPYGVTGAASALYEITKLGTIYLWSCLVLVAIFAVYVFSRYVYKSVEKIFLVVMTVNFVGIIVATLLVARPQDYLDTLRGFFNFGLDGWPKGAPLTLAASLFSQPGGAMMFLSFWILESGWGLSKYSGKVTGVLRPPEEINIEPLQMDLQNPDEVRKMWGWIRLGKWSVWVWWFGVCMLCAYLYCVLGRAVLYHKGIVVTGFKVPLQIAIIMQEIFGPLAYNLFLVFIIFTLCDAAIPTYDTFIGRVTSDAIATRRGVRQKRPYRFYYFTVVTVAILISFYLVTIAAPFFLWMLNALGWIYMRGISSALILYANNRLIPEEFRPSRLVNAILVISVIASAIGVTAWVLGYAQVVKL